MSFSLSYRKFNMDYSAQAGVRSFGLYSPVNFSFPLFNSYSLTRFSFGYGGFSPSFSLFGLGVQPWHSGGFGPGGMSFGPSETLSFAPEVNSFGPGMNSVWGYSIGNSSFAPLFAFSSPRVTQSRAGIGVLGQITAAHRSNMVELSSQRSAGRSDWGKVEGDALFEEGLKFVFGAEGGYANVKGDRGGETNMGVTHKTYSAWLKKKGLPDKSVKNITKAEARQIYYEEFWQALGCSKLPKKLALFVFDTGVNMGVGAAKEFINYYRQGKSLEQLISIREQRYRNLAAQPDQKQFLKGWLNRLDNLERQLAVA